MYKKRLYLLLLCYVILLLPVKAQPPALLNFETLTIADGLPGQSVTAITQDKQGFMWFGTTAGLARYDGYHVIKYNYNDEDSGSISSNAILSIIEDFKQRLWISTDNGLNYFDRQHHHFYRFLTGSKVHRLREDAENNLWAVINGRTVIKINAKATSQKIILDTQQLASFDAEVTLYQDSHKNIYVIGYSNLYKIVYNHVSNSYVLNPLLSYSVTEEYKKRFKLPKLFEDKATHHFYLQVNGDITEFPAGNFKTGKKIFSAKANFCFVDNKQRIWYQSSVETDAKVFITQIDLKTYTVRKVTTANELISKFLAQMKVAYFDKNGTLWIGTEYGVLKYSEVKNQFNISIPQGTFYALRQVRDSGIQVMRNILIWVNKAQTISKIDTLLNYHPAPYSGIAPYFQDVDSLGFEWYGDGYYLIKHKPVSGKIEERILIEDLSNPELTKKLKELKRKDSIAGSTGNYLSSFNITKNRVWMLLDGLLITYNTQIKKFTAYFPVKEFDGGAIVMCYYEGTQNEVWISALNCCYCFNMQSGKIVQYTFKKKAINSFYDDPFQPEKYIWLCTETGLSKLDKQTGICKNFAGAYGLPAKAVVGIMSDSIGNLWISSATGLCRFHLADSTIQNFNESDGLQSNEFNQDCYFKTKQGTMFFGGSKGLNYFKPENIIIPSPPKTNITDCRIFGKSINYGNKNSPLQQDISYTSSITTRYSKNPVVIEFAGVDYSKTKELIYRYKLEEFDENWNYVGNENTASYTNITPGKYTFIVEASNRNGTLIWGEANTQLQLIITPLWWQTWWFRTIVALIAVGLIYLIYRYRLKQLLQVERVRNRIASDLHDEIGSTLSTISIYSKIAHNQVKVEESKATPLLEKISNNTSEAMQAMSEIVWSVNTKNDKFENIILRMQTLATQVLEAKNYKVHFHASENILNLNLKMQKRRDFYLIYKEVINNIAKHAQGENVWINIKSESNKLKLIIQDDGVGFDTANVRKESNGLLNMQQRAIAINGKFTINTSQHEGTVVELQFTYN